MNYEVIDADVSFIEKQFKELHVYNLKLFKFIYFIKLTVFFCAFKNRLIKKIILGMGTFRRFQRQKSSSRERRGRKNFVRLILFSL